MGGRLAEKLLVRRAQKRAKWPTKRFADGSLWRLRPRDLEPVEQIEPPDPKKGWQE